MGKIVRTRSSVTGGITAAEKILLDRHAREWIGKILRTAPANYETLKGAVCELYKATNLPTPRVVLVPSPFVMALAGGFAAAIWHLRSFGGGIFAATRAATDAATLAATLAATDAATHAATRAATRAATLAATDTATDAPLVAETGNLARFFLKCVARWWNMCQGGAMWGQYDCYLTAFRDVLGLELECHEKYQAWEKCATEGGFRVVHEKFCIVSDFPEFIRMDEQNRPHCEDGPSHRWRDGWSLWHVHGTRVPCQVVELPATLAISQIQNEPNVEIRRIMIDRFGKDRYILESGCKPIHQDDWGTLYRTEVLSDEPLAMLKVTNSTREADGSYKDYWLRVQPELRPMRADGSLGEPQEMTAHNAVASTFGMTGAEYVLRQQT